MNAIIQHTFNSGLGDAIVAISEYLHNTEILVSNGYKVDLKINTTNNMYYKNFEFFDFFDEDNFKIFNSVEFINEPIENINGFEIKHISYGASKPGLHWWDLFLDNINNLQIEIFPQSGLTYGNLPLKNNIKLSKQIHNMYQNLNYSNYSSIYLRPNDCDDNIDLYENKINEIINIYNNNNNIFICSNSYTLKQKLINNPKTLSINIPMEDTQGNHIYHNQRISDQKILKERAMLSLLEILILANSNRVYFATSWNRISNFLFYSTINNIPISYI